MIAGLTGSLLSHDAVSGALDDLRQGMPIANHRWFRRWHREVARELGPASSARQVFDRVAVPLAGELGFRVVPCRQDDRQFGSHPCGSASGPFVSGLALVTPWAAMLPQNGAPPCVRVSRMVCGGVSASWTPSAHSRRQPKHTAAVRGV
jgi:hypothetical protein